jgi:hypothetical protein
VEGGLRVAVGAFGERVEGRLLVGELAVEGAVGDDL